MRRRPQADELEMEAIAEEQHREFLLSALRAASLRAKMWDADLTTIGIALKNGMIGTDTAVAWVRDAGLLWVVGAIPDQVGRIAETTNTERDDESASD